MAKRFLVSVFALLFGLGPKIEERVVDVIELNHVMPDGESICYSQVIFWRWSPDYRRYHVDGWYIVEMDTLDGLPQRCQDGRWEAHVRGVRVRAKVFRETWTKTDPEREDKKLRSDELRRGIL